MKFEKFLLDDYLQTAQGKKVYSFFADLKNIYFHHENKFFAFVDSMLDVPDVDIYLFPPDDIQLDERDYGQKEKISSIEKYIQEKPDFWKIDSKGEARDYQTEIPFIPERIEENDVRGLYGVSYR